MRTGLMTAAAAPSSLTFCHISLSSPTYEIAAVQTCPADPRRPPPDCPIAGLVHAANRTPHAPTAGAKNRPRPRCTPGSGEALLCSKVKTLLPKVDVEGAATATIRLVCIHALLATVTGSGELQALEGDHMMWRTNTSSSLLGNFTPTIQDTRNSLLAAAGGDGDGAAVPLCQSFDYTAQPSSVDGVVSLSSTP